MSQQTAGTESDKTTTDKVTESPIVLISDVQGKPSDPGQLIADAATDTIPSSDSAHLKAVVEYDDSDAVPKTFDEAEISKYQENMKPDTISESGSGQTKADPFGGEEEITRILHQQTEMGEELATLKRTLDELNTAIRENQRSSTESLSTLNARLDRLDAAIQENQRISTEQSQAIMNQVKILNERLATQQLSNTRAEVGAEGTNFQN